MKKTFALLNILICLILTSCISTDKKTKIENINIIEQKIILIIGESQDIDYQISPSNIDEELVWTIDDPTIANIDDGVITGLKKGKTTVTISSALVPTMKDIAEVEVVNKSFLIDYSIADGYFDYEVPRIFEYTVGLDTLPIPKRDGYIFLGWYLNDELVISISPDLNQDITLVAKWETLLNDEKADYVINLIDALPYNTSYNDKDEIYDARRCYNELNDETKLLVKNIDILNEKIKIIESIENDLSKITYVLGDNVYSSKEELFENFFSDFYKFIVNTHGDEYLIENSINSIEDFVNLAGDFNGAGVSNLYGIGNLAGRYMLTKDINGILENQPETTFFGYCYKNGLYKDLLPFFIRFFAYWRIDEKYANQNNYGADIFAEGWAPTVDIAKFFYYNEETSYVKTDRMIDCFVNIASVVYGNLPLTPEVGMMLPTNLKLRGYKFLGWYDNPEFSGEPITEIDSISKKIILYAKWETDEYLSQKDKAEIVDIYIYNLTTTKADVSKKTVNYVRKMYEELSNTGKSYVENYNTLITFEEKFAEYFLEPITVNITIELDELIDLESIRNDFIKDFNSITNSDIKSLEELINGRYQYMKKIGDFYKNNTMRGKWIYLLDLLIDENAFYGIEIQVNRIKNNGSGDLEYVTTALAYLLQGKNAESNSEVLVDYSKKEKIDSLINQYGNCQITFEKEAYLPVTNLSGYDFIGYYNEDNNQVIKVEEGMKTNLIAKYVKK